MHCIHICENIVHIPSKSKRTFASLKKVDFEAILCLFEMSLPLYIFLGLGGAGLYVDSVSYFFYFFHSVYKYILCTCGLHTTLNRFMPIFIIYLFYGGI